MYKGLKSRQLPKWCKQLLRIGLLSCVVAIAIHGAIINVTMAASPFARLEDWRFNPQTQQLEIAVSSRITPTYFYLPQPPRVVIDLPDTQLGYVSTRQDFSGAIQSVRVSQLKAGITRIVMDLSPGTVLNERSIQLQSIPGQNQTRWVLSPSLNYAGYQQGNINTPLRGDSLGVPANSSNYNDAPSNGRNLPTNSGDAALPVFNGVNSNNDSPVNIYNGYNNNSYNNRPSNVITVPGVNTPTLPPVAPNIYGNSQNPLITIPSTGGLLSLPPAVNYNPALPITVNVPSLNSNNPNPGQLPPAILPPAVVNQQSGVIPGEVYPVPNTRRTDFPVPIINTINNTSGTQVLEYGRPLPNN
jgi:AMIN domain